MYGLGVPFAGVIVDLVRRKPAILAGLHVWSIIRIATALSRNSRCLTSDDGPGRELGTMDGGPFTLSWQSAEPRGYLSVCQSADGVIQLISSRLHYALNLAWLKAQPPERPTTNAQPAKSANAVLAPTAK